MINGVKRRWLARLIGLLGVGLMFLPGAGAPSGLAQEQESDSIWSEPIQLSEVGQSSWFPDMIVDRSGRVHIAYATGLLLQTGGFDQVMYTASDDGVTWTEPNDIAALAMGPNRESEVARPSLFLDESDVLNMTYRGLGTFSVFFTRVPISAAGMARSWSPRQEVGNIAYFSRVAVDRRGNIHVIYTSNITSKQCPICYHIFYRQSTDGGATWSEAIDISRVNSGSAKPQLLIDPEDRIHVAWESARGGTLGRVDSPAQLLYTSSTDGGVTWREPALIQMPESEGSLRVGLTIDARGRLMIVSTAVPENQAFYSLSSDHGQTWSLPAEVAGLKGSSVSVLDNLSVAVDGAGRVHLVCNCSLEAREGEYNLTHVVWDGTEWSEPDIIRPYKGDLPEWPVIAVGLGNTLHVTWFVRNEAAVFDSDRGQYTIWYAQTTIDAPSVTPIPRPTLPPTATAPPIAQVIEPTARPTATQVLISGVVDPTNPYNEQDYVLLVAISILPVLLIVTGIIVYQRVIRR